MGRLFVYRNFSIQTFPANYNKKSLGHKNNPFGVVHGTESETPRYNTVPGGNSPRNNV